MINNNPCKRCIVNPMCQFSCYEFVEYIKEKAPDGKLDRSTYEGVADAILKRNTHIYYDPKRKAWLWAPFEHDKETAWNMVKLIPAKDV